MSPRQRFAIFAGLLAGAIAWASFRPVRATPAAPAAPLERDAADAGPRPNQGGSTVLVIESNTQATEGDLRIAAFNFREESYKDAAGKDDKGMTCALSVFVKDDETKNQKLRVHRGQKFDVAGRAFEILEVLPSSVKLTIR